MTSQVDAYWLVFMIHKRPTAPYLFFTEILQLKDKHKTNRKKREISTKDSKMNSIQGDVANDDQSNDGFFCAICDKPYRDGDAEEIWISCGNVSDDGIVTDGCGGWSHLCCSNLAQHNLSTTELESVLWHCPRCVECYLSEADRP